MSQRSLRFLLTVLVLVLFDQVTKAIAHALDFDHSSVVPIGNPDTALGLISGSQNMLIAITACGVLAFGTYLVHRMRKGLPHWIAGLLIAGAASNLIDRLAIGYVRDFIVLPGVIVNLADLFLATGTIALLVLDFRPRTATRIPRSAERTTSAEPVAAR